MTPRKYNHQMKKIKDLFSEKIELSSRDIANLCHMDKRNAIEYLRILHEDGDIHIGEWLPYSVPLYVNGPGTDAKKLSRKMLDLISARKSKHRAAAIVHYEKYTNVKSVTAFMVGVI